ncbi:MAG: SpoIIE family protein phosphatase [Terracidiphilus sp.]
MVSRPWKSFLRDTPGFVLLLAVLLLQAAMGHGQTAASASDLSANPPATFSIEGNHPQVASLDGLWRFHPGDDARWAEPGFDDSHWALIRSDKPWNRQGYPHTFGYAWYRFTFEQRDGSRSLALLLPKVVSGYQIYVNGQQIGSVGSATPTHDPRGFPRPQVFQIPTGAAGPRMLHFAVRVWAYQPLAFWAGAGMRDGRSAVGDPAVLARQLFDEDAAFAVNYVSEYGFGLLELVAGITVLGLYLFHPADREYMWFSIVFLADAVGALLHLMLNLASMPFILWRSSALVMEALSGIATLMFFSIVLGARRSVLWWLACIALAASPLTAALIYFQWTSVGVSFAVEALCLLPMQFWIIGILAVYAIRRNIDARLLLIPAALYYGADLVGLLGRITWQITGNPNLDFGYVSLLSRPFPLGLIDVIHFLFILALLIFLVRRFSLARQRETRLSNEMEAARSIQALLVPAAAPSTARFAVESVYLPANEVGGDFFQIIPNQADGSLLIVAGDVSGKGLPAGMLVALLVGAIRAVADTSTDPLRILEALNLRLLGRGDAKATCLALRLDADGSATLANAGHLPPYVNGEPVKMEGALPLGIMAKADFSVMRFQMKEHDRLVLISDGVAEATDRSGNLFGFERVRELVKTAKSAAEVAAAGKAFGQEDDISVVSVVCAGRAVAAV